MDHVYYPVIGLLKSVFAAQGLRFTVTGAEHVPRVGGAVLAVNHTGYFDFAYAGNALLPRRRLIRFMAKEPIFKHPVAGPFMRGMKHISVDRAAGAGAYREAVTSLRSGEIVGVYPEATISRSFELKEFKAGAARMAQEAGVPMIPCIVWGAQRVWTKEHPSRLGWSQTPIYVSIGEPLSVAPDEDVTAATQRLKASMTAVLEDTWARYPQVPEAEQVFVPRRLGGTAPTLEEAEALHQQELARRAAKRAAKQAKRSGH